MPIPDPNKPEQHEGWCPLGENLFYVHIIRLLMVYTLNEKLIRLLIALFPKLQLHWIFVTQMFGDNSVSIGHEGEVLPTYGA